jgi:phosphoenolpyruvate carboxykinase (GTP)
MWPGFGENIRVVKWMMDRMRGKIGGVDSAVGTLPKLGDFELRDLDMSVSAANEILSVNANEIERDARDAQSLLTLIGDTVPPSIWAENSETIARSK